MRNRLRRWLSDATAHDPVKRQKAEFLRVMVMGLFVMGLLGTPLSLIAPLSPIQHALTISADLLMAGFMLAGLLVLRTGRLHVAVLLATCGLLVPLAITFVALGPARGNLVLVSFVLPVALAGLLSGRNSLIFTIIASLAIVGSMIAFSAPPSDTETVLPVAIIVSVFALVLIVLGFFLERFGASLYHTLNVMAARERELELNREVLEQRTAALEREISERKRAEIALRESEERYRLITENTNDLINLFDLAPNLTCVYASPSYARVLGYQQPALEFANYFELVHPDDLPLMFEQFTLLGSQRSTQITVRARHADGSWRWIETHATGLSRDGHYYAVTVGRDITDRKRLEAQFLQAQKMESIGQLAGGIAHDFNNLLTAILGNTEMALDVLPSGHSARDDVSEIKKAADRAVGLTRQLLAFARKQIIEPHVIDLNRLILDMDGLLRRLLGEDVELATVPAAQLWSVKGDPSQIEQVVINLAVNARDAMPAGGRLMIETGNVLVDHTSPEQNIGVPAGSYVMLAVSDTGIGMNEETQRRVFEPFFTTKPKGRGTGLGLATCYGIIKQHGGNIWLYSEVDSGTTFKIYLPGIDEPADDLRPAVISQELPRGSETILLVEDEAAVRALAARILRAQGYQVFEASQGREALSIIDARPNMAIDLLLTDVVMPQMSGRVIAENLQGRYPDLKVLYISGYTDNAIVQHGRLKPGVSFLHKPFTPVALVRKVRDVLGL